MRGLLIIIVACLCAGAVIAGPAYTFDQTIESKGDVTIYNINGSYPNWTAFEFQLQDLTAYAEVIMQVTGNGYAFETVSSVPPWIRFPSTTDEFVKGKEYPERDYTDAAVETWYTIRVERTGPNRGNITVYEGDDLVHTVETTLETAIDGPFVPSGIKFKTSKSYEHGKMRNFKLWTEASQEPAPEPAPNNSILLVEPGWHRVLQASTLGQPMRITDNATTVQDWLTEHKGRPVYQIGDVRNTPANTTVIGREAITTHFPPTDPVTADTREGLLYAGVFAHLQNRTLVFDDPEAEVITREMVAERIEPTERSHLVLADASMPSSALVPMYVAEKQAWLEAATSERPNRFSTTAIDTFMAARDRGLGAMDAGLVGSDPGRAFSPLYLTLFGTPYHNRSGLSDRPYFDQTGNNRTDLAGGRFPVGLVPAARLLRNDDTADNVTVATSYADDGWYETLERAALTIRRTGTLLDLLRAQGKQPDLYMERRARTTDVSTGSEYLSTATPVMPFLNPYGIRKFVDSLSIEGLRSHIETGIKTADKVQNPEQQPASEIFVGEVVTTVKDLYKVNRQLQFLLEHRAAINRSQVQQAFIFAPTDAKRQELLLDGLFEPKPELDHSAIADDHGGIVWLGRSTDTWTVPIDGDYRDGTEQVMPRTVEGLVFDGSGDTITTTIPKSLVAAGATNYLGFSQPVRRYAAAEAATRFYDNGFSTGAGYKAMMNDFHEHLNGFASVRYGHRLGFVETARDTPILYGDPTTFTDPEPVIGPQPVTDCGADGQCTHTWSITTDYTVVNESLVLEDVKQERFEELPDLFYHERSMIIPAGTNHTIAINATRKTHALNISGTQEDLDSYEIQEDRLPDNRTKLTIRHLATKLADSSVTVFDRMNITVKTDQPVAITDVSTQTETGHLTVNSRIQAAETENLTAVITVSNETMERSRPIDINRSPVTIDAGFGLGPGTYRIEVGLAGPYTAGPVSRLTTVPRPMNVSASMSVPSAVTVGDRFLANITLRNHGRPIETQLDVDYDRGIYPAVLADTRPDLVLETDETVTASVPVHAGVEGNHWIAVESLGANATIDVDGPELAGIQHRLPEQVSIDPAEETIRYQDRQQELGLTFTETGYRSWYRSVDGKVTHRMQPGSSVFRIESPDGVKTVHRVRGRQAVAVNGTVRQGTRLRDRLERNEKRLLTAYYGATAPGARSVDDQ